MLSVNQVIQNRYRVERLVGQGGFGAVYRVRDLQLNLTCALKENFETSAAAQRQFIHEATILSGLRHPNLTRVTDHFTLPGQGQYLVMDYIEGVDLKTRLQQAGTPLPISQVIPWILQITDALAYLHGQKPPIIHRDLKPENIIITPQNTAILVDFGVAKVYDPALKTTIGARAVTPGFSPPEQYGQGTTDNRSDIYALGATLYTLVTNQEPVESIQRTLRVPLVSPRQVNPLVSPALDSAILKAMEPVPADRFQRMEHFKAALTQQQNMAPRPRPVAAPVKKAAVSAARKQTLTIMPPRSMLLLILGTAAVLILLVALGLSRQASQQSPLPAALPTLPAAITETVPGAIQGTIQAEQTRAASLLLPAVTPFPTSTLKPSAPTATRIAVSASKTPIDKGNYTCVLISYLQDITVPDGSVFSPGSGFIKTWRLQNVSNCTLEKDARLVFLGGDPMGSEEEFPITIEVVPGQVFDVSIPLAAPGAAGRYKSEWGIKTSEGSLISGLQLSVEIEVR